MKKFLSIALATFAMTAAAQQTVTVTGVITTAQHSEGQPGARISVMGGQQTVLSDETGKFSVDVPSLDACLTVSAPGYATKTVYLQGRNTLELNLLAEETARDRVSVLPAQGEAFTVRQSGQPGAASNVFVRGLHSINLSSQPLYVVDGVIWQMQEDGVSSIDGYTANPLNILDPDDIESVEILRNGVAVWGAKAAAGVVSIKTKRAHDMVTRIEANISMGLQQKFASLPMMDAADYKRYATDVMSGMDKAAVSRLLFTNDDASKLSYFDTHNATDWLSLVNENAMLQRYGINVAGGDERALYRFSLGYEQNDGNIKGSSFNRLNIRFNADINLSRNFTVGSDIFYAQTNTDAPISGINDAYSPYYIGLAKSPLYGPYQHNAEGVLTNRLCDVDELGVSNPLALIGDQLPQAAKQRFTIALQPRYQFTRNLSLAALLAFSWDKENQDIFMADGGISDQNLTNAKGEIFAIGLNEVRNLMQRQSALSANVHLDYDILTGWQHQLKATLGGRFYNVANRYTAGRGYNTGSDYMKALSNTNSSLRWITGDSYTDRDLAWYLQADYCYLARYGVTAAAALQASSRYGEDAGGLSLAGTSWMPTAQAEAFWNLSSEQFMQHLKGVDARLRLGWTMTGNDRLPLNASRTYLSSASLAQNAVGNVVASIGNSSLKWETTHQLNLGLDLGFFHNRWTMGVDLYRAMTSDLINRYAMVAESGLANYWANGGKLRSQGVEFRTSARILEKRDWRIAATAILGSFHNEVTELPGGESTVDIAGARILTTEGQPVGVFYGFETAGVFATAAEAQSAGLGIKTANGEVVPFEAGDMHFVDQNHDGLISDEDRVIIGDPTPDFYGSMALSLQWKNLSISPEFSFVCGGDVYNALRADLESGSSLHNQTKAMLNRWTADGQTTTMPRVTYGDPMGNARFSDRWIEDGSYLRLKTLTVSYDIPFQAAMLQNIRVFASAYNVFTLTRYLGADPETAYSSSVLSQGIDAGLTPQSRSFVFGVKINL